MCMHYNCTSIRIVQVTSSLAFSDQLECLADRLDRHSRKWIIERSAVSLAPAPHSNPSRSCPRLQLVSSGRQGRASSRSCRLLPAALLSSATVYKAVWGRSVTKRGVKARSILPLGSLELELLQRAVVGLQLDVIPEASASPPQPPSDLGLTCSSRLIVTLTLDSTIWSAVLF